MPNRSKLIEAFQQMVDSQGEALRGIPFAELRSLANTPTEIVKVGEAKGSISLIIEDRPDGWIRVVVQGFIKTGLLGRIGFSNVALDGFYKSPDNEIHPMPEKEFYEFD